MSEEIKKMVDVKSEEKRQDLARKLSKKLKDIDEIYDTEDMVKDNKIYFPYKELEYRIRKSTRQEKRKMGEIRTQKFNQLLQEVDEDRKPKYIVKEQHKDMYEKRGINCIEQQQSGYISEEVIEDQIRCDAYLLYRRKKRDEQKEEQTTTENGKPKPVDGYQGISTVNFE